MTVREDVAGIYAGQVVSEGALPVSQETPHNPSSVPNEAPPIGCPKNLKTIRGCRESAYQEVCINTCPWGSTGKERLLG
jgi:hypothetical protein